MCGPAAAAGFGILRASVPAALPGIISARPRAGRGGDDPAVASRHGDDPATPEESMNWIVLFVAGLFEIGWAIGLKYTDGFTRPLPTAATLASMAISVYLLGLAMKALPVGTAYAVWVGVGAVGTAILGIYLFGESASPGRLASLGLIIAGIIGLKLATPG